jgi:hypothetical protein
MTSTRPKPDVNAILGLMSVVSACKFYYLIFF